MTLTPTRMRPARALRALVRPRFVVRFLALVAAAALLESIPVPGTGFAAWVMAVLVAPLILWSASVPTRTESERLRATLRAPRAADPATVPPPTQRSYRWLMVAQGAGVVTGWAVAIGAVVATPFVARGTFGAGVLPGDLPNGAAWVLCPLLACGVGAFSSVESRVWWRGRRRQIAGLSRGRVTVLGYGTSPPYEVFRRLGDVQAGDVLVRTGSVAPGTSIHLSDGTRGRWTGPLRVVPRSELRTAESAAERGGDR